MKPSATMAQRRGVFRVLEFLNPSGATAYRVTGTKLDGTRIRTNYVSQGEAEAERQRLMIEAENQADSVKLAQTRLTTEQLRDAEAAVAELGDRGTLVRAVRHFIATWKPSERQARVPDAVEQFIAARTQEGLRKASIQFYRVFLRGFTAAHSNLLVNEITPDIARAFIYTDGASPATISARHRALSAFLGWAEGHGLRADNPCAKIKKPKRDQPEPAILTMDEAERFLRNAEEFKGGILLPYTVLALLGGIRPEEVRRLDWSAIDLEAGTVTIQGAHAKTRARRIVELPANGVEFLRLAKNRKLPVVSPNWRKDFDTLKASVGYGGRAKESDGLKPWPSDMLRHTAISVHLAVHEHEGKTALWAGNSPDIIQRHYKGLISKSEAAHLYTVRPASAKRGKVIQFAV